MCNKCFPLKTTKIGYKTNKGWLSDELKNAIKIKNRLYRKSKKTKDPNHELIYKRFRNKLNGLLAKAERNHYSKLMEQHKNNLKKSWTFLKEVINKKKSETVSSRFVINNRITTDKTEIANGFNSFFVNVGPTLANKIPHDNRPPDVFMKNRAPDDIILNSVLPNEIVAIIRNLKDGGAGWDCISARVVKSTYAGYLKPLTHILNLSLEKGIFPHELKVAHVIHLFKSGSTMNFSNYRPVSILPVFSKIFERIMYNRLLFFIEENNILFSINLDLELDILLI